MKRLVDLGLPDEALTGCRGLVMALHTAVTLPEPGAYVLRLTADDGQQAASDDVTVVRHALANGSTYVTDSGNFAADHDVAHLWDGFTDAVPEHSSGSGTGASLWVEFDLGAPHDLTRARLFGDADGNWRSTAWTLRHRLAATAGWSDAFVDAAALANDWCEPTLAVTARYVRVEVAGSAAGTLARRLADAGKKVFFEVVHPDPARTLEAARLARAAGVDYLLGSVYSDAVQAELAGQVSYLPFVGRTAGHPTRLAGSLSEILADGRRLAGCGVHGLDLLAHRHVDKRVGARLVQRLREAVALPVCVAGSINSLARIQAVCAAGAWAFTVGTALFEGTFVPGGTLRQQVLAAFQTSLEPRWLTRGFPESKLRP